MLKFKFLFLFSISLSVLNSISYEYLIDNSYSTINKKIELEQKKENEVKKIKNKLEKEVIAKKNIKINPINKDNIFHLYKSKPIEREIKYFTKINSKVRVGNNLIYDKNYEFYLNNQFKINTFSIIDNLYNKYKYVVLNVSCVSKITNKQIPLLYSYMNIKVPNECLYSYFSRVKEERIINLSEIDNLHFIDIEFKDNSYLNFAFNYDKSEKNNFKLFLKNTVLLNDNYKLNKFKKNVFFEYFSNEKLEILKINLDYAKTFEERKEILEKELIKYEDFMKNKFSGKNMLKNNFFINFPENIDIILLYKSNK